MLRGLIPIESQLFLIWILLSLRIFWILWKLQPTNQKRRHFFSFITITDATSLYSQTREWATVSPTKERTDCARTPTVRSSPSPLAAAVWTSDGQTPTGYSANSAPTRAPMSGTTSVLKVSDSTESPVSGDTLLENWCLFVLNRLKFFYNWYWFSA